MVDHQVVLLTQQKFASFPKCFFFNVRHQDKIILRYSKADVA